MKCIKCKNHKKFDFDYILSSIDSIEGECILSKIVVRVDEDCDSVIKRIQEQLIEEEKKVNGFKENINKLLEFKKELYGNRK